MNRDRDLELAMRYEPPAYRYQPPKPAELDWPLVRGFLARYKWTVLGVFLATVASGYVTLSLFTEQYDVESEILVKLGRENLDPPATSRNLPLAAGLRREELMSEVQILRSPALIRRLVDQIGPEAFEPRPAQAAGAGAEMKARLKSVARGVKDWWKSALIALDLNKGLSERDTAVQDLLERLAVEPRKDSDVIAIKLRMANPALAVDLQERLIGLYMRRRVDVRRSEGVKEFLDTRAAQRKAELQKAELDRMTLKRSKGLVSASDQKSLLLRQADDVRSGLIRTRSEIENLTRQIAAGREQMNATPAFERASEQTTPNPLAEKLRQQVADLQSERATLLTKYQPESIPVKNIDERLKDLREMLSKERTTQPGSVTSSLNPVRQNLEQKVKQDIVRLDGLRASEQVQARNLAAIEVQARTIDDADAALTDIDRKQKIAESEYLEAMKRSSDADVASELDRSRISNVSILTPPTSTLTPVYPKKLLVMGVLLPVGFVLGIAVAMLLHYAGGGSGTVRELESALAIPCLGEVDLKPRLLGQ